MPSAPFSRRAPGVARRRGAWALAATFILILTVLQMYEFRVRIAAAVGKYAGFSQVRSFPLRDSLPALGGSLSNLEAFKFALGSTARANPERSIWVDDSLRVSSIEYFADKNPFDSVTLMVWSSDSFAATRTYRGDRDIAWKLPRSLRPGDWTELVATYSSYPKILAFRSADPSVRFFEPIEGKVLHLVRGRYRNHHEQVTPADTSYPVQGANGDLQLLARGNALAVVNPSAHAVSVRILSLNPKRWETIRIEGKSIHVYRRLLERFSGNIWAYTHPGETFPVLREDAREAARFFLLVK